MNKASHICFALSLQMQWDLAAYQQVADNIQYNGVFETPNQLLFVA